MPLQWNNLQKIRRLSSMKCNVRVQTKEDEELIGKLLVVIFCGGVAGGGYSCQKTYYETRNDTFSDCVGITSFATFSGFVLGGAAVLIFPIVAPIVLVIGTIRYFDSPEPKKDNYTLYRDT
jgi:hypothetical protein